MKHPASAVMPIAQELVQQLAKDCLQIEIVGSLRRRREEVHDIDLLVLTRRIAFFENLRELYGRRPEKWGDKIITLASYKGVQVDIYLAQPDTWATLLLIRTGSKDHNIKLCQRAQARGLQLKANGDGLLAGDGAMLPVQTEQDIFKHLDLCYREPWQRD